MAQSTILAAGTTVASSADVTVAAAGAVTVGLFVSSGEIPNNVSCPVYAVTPGAVVAIGSLSKQTPAMTLPYVGTFRVTRNEAGGASVGVYLESATGGNLSTTTGAGATTGTTTSVAASASDTSLLAADSARKAASVYNDSTAILYLLIGSGTSSATNFTVQVPAGAYYEVPANLRTLALRGIWSSATGSARITAGS